MTDQPRLQPKKKIRLTQPHQGGGLSVLFSLASISPVVSTMQIPMPLPLSSS